MFQNLINMIIGGLASCSAYIDEAVTYSDNWKQQLETFRAFFNRLSDAKLMINLAKSEFCGASLTFQGHVVSQGHVKPMDAKVEAAVYQIFPYLHAKDN